MSRTTHDDPSDGALDVTGQERGDLSQQGSQIITQVPVVRDRDLPLRCLEAGLGHESGLRSPPTVDGRLVDPGSNSDVLQGQTVIATFDKKSDRRVEDRARHARTTAPRASTRCCHLFAHMFSLGAGDDHRPVRGSSPGDSAGSGHETPSCDIRHGCRPETTRRLPTHMPMARPTSHEVLGDSCEVGPLRHPVSEVMDGAGLGEGAVTSMVELHRTGLGKMPRCACS